MALPSLGKSPLLNQIRQVWQRRFFYWVDKRAPLASIHKLTHKNLYTFPNILGFLFLGLIVVIWVMGTNYQNNLILGLCYLLVSLFVVGILHAYANLAGISIRFISTQPTFAGERAGFILELSVDHLRGSEAVQLRWAEGDPEPISLKPGEPQRVTLWLASHKRGHLSPGRLLVQSTFPLGIIRCWTWLRLDAKALIYPQPVAIEEPHATLGQGNEEGGGRSLRGDEFSGLRTYVPGDSIKHIAWKQFAQDKGLYTKEYQQLLSAEKWLDWYSLYHPQEERLAGLCYWALYYEQQHISYGLNLPGLQLQPDQGPNHLSAVLSALALFNLKDA